MHYSNGISFGESQQKEFGWYDVSRSGWSQPTPKYAIAKEHFQESICVHGVSSRSIMLKPEFQLKLF
jgi:hypothetical protein